MTKHTSVLKAFKALKAFKNITILSISSSVQCQQSMTV